MDKDKRIEYQRYNDRSKLLLALDKPENENFSIFGSLSILPIYREPYIFYEECIRRMVFKEHNVLELGSGTGRHSYALSRTSSRLVASDISENSLAVLSSRIKEQMDACVADMEFLPFEDNSFSVVASAGSLSYGDPDRVDSEILRVLRPGGAFICVDSLNHNPIYKFNRWLHYLRGDRTKKTIINMPSIARIQSFAYGFKNVEIKYFGSMSYALPLLSLLVGQIRAGRISNIVDKLVSVERSAFKFVLVASGRL